MIKIRFLFLGLLFSHALSVAAQDKPAILLQIGNENIEAEEFWTIYKKNSQIGSQSEKTSLKEYLDLYINFKLKVMEAKETKMDTAKAFREELAGYRKQLVQPYLVVEKVDDETVKQLYDRMQYNVRASHILLRLPNENSENDTMLTYQKGMRIRAEIEAGKLYFTEAAIKYSEDPSARDMLRANGQVSRYGNKGDIGYFSVFDMVLPFEEAAFKLKKGEVSFPIRTQFGYHLIQLTDKIKAIGEVNAAHIFIRKNVVSGVDSAKITIDNLYSKINSGDAFEDVALMYSEDLRSREKGGALPAFGANRMVPEFISAVSNMKSSDISRPVESLFGWHIIKFISQKPIQDFDVLKEEIKEKLKKDQRSSRGRQAKVDEIRKEENVQEYPLNLQEIITLTEKSGLGKEPNLDVSSTYLKPIFSIGEKTFTQLDFLNYLKEKKPRSTTIDAAYTKKAFVEFTSQICLDHEEEHLEEKYQDFRLIMNEYREGILLFDLMDKKIWSRASKDSIGLLNYYKSHSEKYHWKTRARVYSYKASDPKLLNLVRERLLKGEKIFEIVENSPEEQKKSLSVDSLVIEKDDSHLALNVEWKKRSVNLIKNDLGLASEIIVFRDIIPAEEKSLEEARGLVIVDFQDYLEQEWISQLKNRYSVKVNRKVFRKLKEREKR